MAVELNVSQRNTDSWKYSIDDLTKRLLTPRVRYKEKSWVEGFQASIGDDIKKVRYPRLVLSVIGDSSSFVPQPWVTQVFKLGLIETAKGATDCLILYKGSREKVSTLVWEAVDDFRVMNNHRDRDETFIKLAGLGPTDGGWDVSKNDGQNKKLDENKNVMETYYKLVDSYGEEWKLENYGKYHAMLLAQLAEESIPFVELKDYWRMKVPTLVIVAEGDERTLDAVVEVLQKNIPVLILQGSGKAADLIAECIEDEKSVKVKAPLLFGIYFDENRFQVLSKQMKKIEEHMQLVNIFNINEHDEKDFPDAVVNAIIRAWAHGGKGKDGLPVKSAMRRSHMKDVPGDEKYRELDREILYAEYEDQSTPGPTIASANDELTSNGSVMNGVVSHRKKSRSNSVEPLPSTSGKSVRGSCGTTVTLHNVTFNESEVKSFMTYYKKSLQPASLRLYFYIAYQFIQEVSSTDIEDRKKNFQILLQQAIIADRVDYVTVLLQEEGVQFDSEHFKKIYKDIKCPCKVDGDCQHIRSILKGASSSATEGIIQKKDFGIKIQSGRQLCQKLLHYPQTNYDDGEYSWHKKDGEYQRKQIFHDLLIWALFANRRELAALFWKNCDNQLLTAILACCVLKKMASRARSGKDQFLYNDLKTHSHIFEKRATDMQTKLYSEDPDTAMELMLAEHAIWDIKVSPLECAFDNAMLDFIAHSCAQRKLNTIWYKKIGATLSDFWKNGFFCGCRRIKERVTDEDGQEKKQKRRLILKFLYAPLTRFLVHYMIFLAAILCYSAFLLIELSQYNGIESILIYEWILYIWLFADIMEEYRGVLPWNHDIIRSRFSKKDSKEKAINQSRWYRFRRYVNDFWNALDLISYMITISAILVRFFYKESYARRLHSLGLFTIYMRFLHAVLLSRKLGPKIIMIKEMLKDLFRFVGILFIFMMGVGILYHANMYPAHYDFWNKKGWTYWRIWKIMYIPYWQIYGELFLDTFEANSTTPCTTVQSEWENNPEIERCNEYDWVLIVIAALYMLISNLLLVNLVIAVFSYRFEIVQANSERLWRYWRYAVIMDYRTRVPAPLNLVLRPFMAIYKCAKRCTSKKEKIDKDAINRMEILQTITANKCIRDEKIAAE